MISKKLSSTKNLSGLITVSSILFLGLFLQQKLLLF
jgi:hypothetical protein